MIAFQLLPGLLLHGILDSLATGLVCYVILLVTVRLFPSGSAAAKYLLCNVCLLLVMAAFLRPFAMEAFAPVKMIASSAERVVVIEAQDGVSQPAAKAATSAKEKVSSIDELPGNVLGFLRLHADAIMLMYGVGLLLFLLKLSVGYYKMQRMRRNGLLEPDNMWQEQMDAVIAKLKIRRAVRLAFSSIADAPCIIGHAKAIVLIPIALACRLDMAQAEAVLLHELAHYRQYHYYINLCARVVATIQFYNPFAWLLLRLANRHREYACDAFAVRHSKGVALAESLVVIAEHKASVSPLALSLYSPKNQLLHRIQILLQMKTNTSPSRTAITAFLIVVLAACCCYGTLRAVPAPKSLAKEDTLAAISRKMQADTNLYFLYMEALRDSLIKFDAPYFLAYDNRTVRIDSIPVPEPYQARYKSLLDQFNRNVQENIGYGWTIMDDGGVSLKDVLNPASKFRKKKFKPDVASTTTMSSKPTSPTSAPSSLVRTIQGSVGKTGATKILSEALIADGLVNQGEPIFIKYSYKTLTVNNHVLTSGARSKYEELLKEDIDFANPIDSALTVYRIYPEGVMAPTTRVEFRNGSSVISFPRSNGKPYVYSVPSIRKVDASSMYNLFAGHIAVDELCDTASTLHVVYNKKGIFVNDTKLEGAKHQKYELLIREAGYAGPKKDDDVFDATF